MPDSYGAYPHTTVAEYLDFFARAYRYAGDERRRRVDEVVAFTGLGAWSDREMKALSKGMAQRLSMARALLHDPEVLLLDEPAAGLDPAARVEFKRLVRLLAADGKTLFISSHILSELEEMCDSLLFIVDGRIVHHGSAAGLKAAATGGVHVLVKVAGPSDRLAPVVAGLGGVEFLDPVSDGGRLRLESDSPEFVASVLKRLIDAGVPVTDFRREERRLEEAFIDLVHSMEGK
jgi:ABC-2 type transport system ATP-binding protein